MSERTPGLNSTATTMTRRDFTLDAALAVLAGCVITVTDACGKNSTPAPAPPTPPPADMNANIADNHGHSGVLMGAQISAGNAIALSIQGTAAHPHTVSLTQADLQTLTNRRPPPQRRESCPEPGRCSAIH